MRINSEEALGVAALESAAADDDDAANSDKSRPDAKQLSKAPLEEFFASFVVSFLAPELSKARWRLVEGCGEEPIMVDSVVLVLGTLVTLE